MKTLFIGKNCIEVAKTGSTNSYLAALSPGNSAKTGDGRGQPTAVYEGTVVVANHQELGRGQRGSTWESEPGKNLTLSILLQPTFLRIEEQFQLNMAISLGVMEFITLALTPSSSIEVTEGCAQIKWPNDIYLSNKKVAGILIENSVSDNILQQSIIGIGINVNQEKFSEDLPNPTSLKLATGREFDLKECLEQLCSCIERRYLELRNRSNSIDEDYKTGLYRNGEFANYIFKGKPLQAMIVGISKAGKLLLEIGNEKILEADFKEVEFK